jgi:hypothetical protein
MAGDEQVLRLLAMDSKDIIDLEEAVKTGAVSKAFRNIVGYLGHAEAAARAALPGSVSLAARVDPYMRVLASPTSTQDQQMAAMTAMAEIMGSRSKTQEKLA